MVQVRIADFSADYDALRRIRFAVFVDEQKVPEDLELDERDAHCVHVLALDDSGEPIGTARIDLDDAGRVGRLAVVASCRRRGVGAALMKKLHVIARDNGLDTVWCHAQTSAVPFYVRLGYVSAGEETFIEAGIEHITMQKTLTEGQRQ